MKFKEARILIVLAVAALLVFAAVFAQQPSVSYSLIATITMPSGFNYTSTTTGNLTSSFDISWIDPGSQRYYLADRTATKGTGRIDVIDTQANTFLYAIPVSKSEIGFTGNVPSATPGCTISGPNGVLAIPQNNQLYVGDGDSTVKVVDLDAKAVVAIIPTGGKCRADEEAYDPLDHIVMIANPNDVPPFVTFISTDTQTVLGHYTYTNRVGGLEQPVWDALTKRFYMSVPSTMTSVGSVDVFNPLTMLMENSYQTTTCSPAGLVLTPNQHLMTSCGIVLDARNGNIIATVAGVNTDQLWYNPGDNRYYSGAPGNVIVDADSNQVVGMFPSGTGHTLAVDPNNNHIFAPTSGVGVKVFAAQ